MALSAVVSLSPSTAPYNARVTALVTISNSGGSAVTLSTLTPLVGPSGEINSGVAISNPTQPINPVSVPAGGSVIQTFNLIPFAPQVVPFSSLTPTTTRVGCNIITSDGSNFAATPATLTISPPVAN